MSEKDTLILAIESSCDETAASVVEKRKMCAVLTLFHPRSPSIPCMAVLCRKLHPENISKNQPGCRSGLKRSRMSLWMISMRSVLRTALVLSAHFSVGVAEAKAIAYAKRNRWSAFTILKATSRRTISNTRISEPPFLCGNHLRRPYPSCHCKDYGSFRNPRKNERRRSRRSLRQGSPAIGLGYPGGPEDRQAGKRRKPARHRLPRVPTWRMRRMTSASAA